MAAKELTREQEEEKYILLLELKKRETLRSFYAFLVYFWDVIIPDEYIDNWHIEYICDELQILSDCIINRKPKPYDLIINVPPGSSKSTIATVMWPVWLWVHDPGIVILSSSYSSGLSTDHAIKSRDIIRSEKFQELYYEHFIDKCGEPFAFKRDKDNKTNYGNIFNGERSITSTGGTVTGKHGHVIIQDDPQKPQEVESKKARESAIAFNDRTLSSRTKDKENTPRVVIMQRLHEEDLTGHILSKKDNVKHICLPAELSDKVRPASLSEKYVNNLLDPRRLNNNVLAEAKIDLGSYGYAGQFGQTPAPAEGGILKKEWFGRIQEEDLPKGLVWDFYIDGAYTKDTNNDPSGFMAVAYQGNQMYIRSAIERYYELPEALKFIPNWVEEENYSLRSMINIEPKASGKSMKQMLVKEGGLNVKEIKSKAVQMSKIERAHNAAPICESGRVHLVAGNWNKAFLDQVSSFPNAAHDEHVDNLCYAIFDYFLKQKKRKPR